VYRATRRGGEIVAVEVLPVGVTHDLEAEDPIVVAAMLYVSLLVYARACDVTCVPFVLKDPGRPRDHDRRYGWTVLSPSWRHPSPRSVFSRSCLLFFVTLLFLTCSYRLLASRRQSRPSARRDSHLRPRTALYVSFLLLKKIPLPSSLHIPYVHYFTRS
jgi:hypothetical protein